MMIVSSPWPCGEEDKGVPAAEVDAARLCFWPILTTSSASITGFMPRLAAPGAGAASQQAIGVAAMGGMIAATFS